jgi:hypothetical protein
MSYGREAEMAIQSSASRVAFVFAARDVLRPDSQPYSAFAPTVIGRDESRFAARHISPPVRNAVREKARSRRVQRACGGAGSINGSRSLMICLTSSLSTISSAARPRGPSST